MIFLFIGGQSGAGKTSLSQALKDEYQDDAVIINMDDYFKERPEGRDAKEYRLNTIFDTPEMLDLEKLIEQLSALKNNIRINKPIFNFESNRSKGTEKVNPTQVIIVEGIFAQYFYKHYVESKNWPALSINTVTESYTDIINSRCLRDQVYRGLSRAEVLYNERHYVAPGFFKYTASCTPESHIYANAPRVDFGKQLSTMPVEAIKALLANSQEKITAALKTTVEEIKEAIAERRNTSAQLDTDAISSNHPKDWGQILVRKSHEEYNRSINERTPELLFCGLFDSYSPGCKAVLKIRSQNEKTLSTTSEDNFDLAQSSTI